MKKLLCLTLLAGAVHAAPASKPLDPAAPQQDLQSVRKAITTLQQDIAQKEAARQQTASAIAQSEEALEATHEALNALEQKQGSSSNQLEQYQAELLGIRMKVAETRQRVGKLLASTYKRGQHDAMNLMLNQGDPNQASRDLTYYTHISRAQQELIARLRDQEIQLQAITERLEDELVRLGRMSAEKVQQKRRIEAAKNQRQVQVSQLDASIRAQQTRLQQLKEDEKQLTVLIARINAEIERRRQEAIKKAAAAKKAHEEAARLAAEKRRQQVAEAKKQGKKPPPEPKAPPVERIDEVVDGSASGRAFKSLQGRMKLPVSGEIAGRFGAARGEGNSWKGLYIRTAPGTPVRVVADGTVVYADWLRGFGNAMIIDHGGNYLTVYTGFSAMARGNGAGVKAGDVLGTSGTMESGETGLYFELRYLGRPINPQSWAR
ncbi:murein hydrolase activator EnvC [Vogesella sp. XCS3]|uniref:murein hydrolase activator EnvC family protein n=1 Tax=Vogesella sp. XCS3 TaxID=2877939 RepID=UPI001D0A2DC7|nr:peptidoglycan DD-metalloendopeptidase family protein [Vogesella sp. XCS3]UDM18710.1 peptidoglycan DD-metalloendopeptidase family protein [Vogesella sp. XCS3]